jgi:hypothetical protein
MQNIASDNSIYFQHLYHLFWQLKSYPHLVDAFAQVLPSDRPVQLPPEASFKLKSLGLVKKKGNNLIVFCELYRQYFKGLFSLNAFEQL